MDTLYLTATEAGYVLDRSPKGINKAIDEGIIRARTTGSGKPVQRLLGAGELRYLGMVKNLSKGLTPVGRKRLYNAVRDLPSHVHRLRFGHVIVDLGDVDADIACGVQRLEVLRQSIEKRSGGDVIKGTQVPVHLVAALAQGQTTAEIIEDYPELSPGMVAMASEYAKAFPKLGRPYPKRSFKRMLESAASAGVFDEALDAGDAEPHLVP